VAFFTMKMGVFTVKMVFFFGYFTWNCDFFAIIFFTMKMEIFYYEMAFFLL
jgi:hypothetical protein